MSACIRPAPRVDRLTPRSLEVRIPAVPLVDHDDLAGPLDPERGIVPAHAAPAPRAHSARRSGRRPRQSSVSVRKPCAQPSGMYSARRFSAESSTPNHARERRRARPQVDRDVEDRAGGAPNELRLLVRGRLVVQPAQRPAATVVRDAALDERADRARAPRTRRVPGAREEPALVLEPLGLDHPDALDARLARTSSDRERELPTRERLGVAARRSALPCRERASARGRAPRRTSACRAGSGTASMISRAFSRASSSGTGTKTFGAPRSPSYFGISYSRMRWSRHVFQVSSQTSR